MPGLLTIRRAPDVAGGRTCRIGSRTPRSLVAGACRLTLAARPSDHLLRTLASVPPGSRVLVLGRDGRGHEAALTALGMDVIRDATPASVDWVVAGDLRDPEEVFDALVSARRALVRGGWAWIGAERQAVTATRMGEIARRAGLAESEAPAVDVADGDPIVRGIYRRVENDTVA